MNIDLARNGAIFSDGIDVWHDTPVDPRRKLHRLLLWRCWDQLSERRLALFIGLNPSVAGAHHDDPTVRRWTGFAKRWGCTGFIAANLYTRIATDQGHLWALSPDDRNHLLADQHLVYALDQSPDPVVACWGKIPVRTQQEASDVVKFIEERYERPVHCFGPTRDGFPRHPVRLSYDTRLRPLSAD